MHLRPSEPAVASTSLVSPGPARVMVVQYAGDYLEAHRRLEETGTETYYGHRYVLEHLARIGRTYGEVAVLCCKSPRPYEAKLPSGVIVVGAGEHRDAQRRAVMDRIAAFHPTHLIVLGPLPRVVRWGLRNGCRVMCLFADSFEVGLLRRLLRHGRLAALLNNPRVDLVANHGVGACVSLARIGVRRDKILPWDWVHLRRPSDAQPKTDPDPSRPSLLFVGSVIARKGIGDAVAALAALRRRGVPAVLKVAGAGEVERYRLLARQLGAQEAVEFLGLVPNDAVFRLMREATAVVVPSQHAYPEGLPLTIYESLCARTPVIASDHPMFVRRLMHRTSAMIYPAGDADALATCVEELLAEPGLYSAISAASQETWEGLQIPAKWGEILFRWIGDGDADRSWLRQHRLDAGLYAAQLGAS